MPPNRPPPSPNNNSATPPRCCASPPPAADPRPAAHNDPPIVNTVHLAPDAETTRHGGRQRGLIALVQILALATWFSASAVIPPLQQEWRITAGTAVWITASTQVGFVVGAVGSAVTNQ